MDRQRGPRSSGAQQECGSLLWAQLGGFLEEVVLKAGVGWKVLCPTKHVWRLPLDTRLCGSEVVR